MNGDFNNNDLNNGNNQDLLNSLNGGERKNPEVINNNLNNGVGIQENSTQVDMNAFNNQQNAPINLTSTATENVSGESTISFTSTPIETPIVEQNTIQNVTSAVNNNPIATNPVDGAGFNQVSPTPIVNPVENIATGNAIQTPPIVDNQNQILTEQIQNSTEQVITTPNISLGSASTMQIVDPGAPNFATQPNGKNNKAKINPVIIIVVVIVLLAILGYFVVFPFIQKTFMSNPKNVFETTIKNAAKEVNSVIDDIPLESVFVDLNLKLDTNIAALQDFSGYTYGVTAGVNPKNKLIEGALYIKDKSNTEYGANAYIKDNKTYIKLHNYNDLIFAGEENQEEMNETFKKLEELFSAGSKISTEDMNYLIDKFTNLLIETLDEEKLSKEDTTLKVNGMEFEATRNTYAVDKTVCKNTVVHIVDGLKNDEKALKVLASLSGVTVDEMKTEMNKEINFDNIEDDFAIKINIYTAGRKNDVVGYDIVKNDKTPISYYSNKGNFELLIKNESSTEFSTDDLKIKINAVKDGDKTDVEILYNDKKVTTLEVSQWDDKGIKFSYVIEVEEEKITGNINYTLTKTTDKNNMNLDISAKSGSDEISVSLGLLLDYKAIIADIDTSKAVTLTEDQLMQVTTNWTNAITTLPPIKALVGTMSGLMDQGSMEEYEDYESNFEYAYDDIGI